MFEWSESQATIVLPQQIRLPSQINLSFNGLGRPERLGLTYCLKVVKESGTLFVFW